MRPECAPASRRASPQRDILGAVCGIAGLYDPKGERAAERETLAAMIGAVHHRGPDETGVRADGPVGLAHARLSIVDLACGQQPMSNEDGSIWVVFNGEIFNHVELRPALEAAGHRFRTRSDTEVIVHAYEEHGLDFLHHFNGQFALALWDGKRKRLVLARDRVGVRPLFYAWHEGRLHFASETKALFAAPGLRPRLDPRGLAEAFCLWAPLDPTTAFEGVRSLPPGHLMYVDAGGAETVRRWWDLRFPSEVEEDPRPPEQFAEELRALLVDAVRLRLRADVPVGAYLSGGLDSSILTAMVKRYTDTPLRTFSVGFEDAEFDEGPYQRALIAHLGTDHTAVRCTKEEIGRAFPRAIWHTEAPLLRTAPVPLMLLARHVHEAGYKVVLTGEGADEMFGGYDLFKEAKLRRFFARHPGSRGPAALLGKLYPYLPSSPVAAPAYAEAFFKQGLDKVGEPFFGHLPRWSTTRRLWRFFSADVQGALRGFAPEEELRRQLPAQLAHVPAFCRDQYVEVRTLLSGYLLSAQGDRVAMAHAVEGRFPFLDPRVIELGARIPFYWKMLGLKEKHILKKATADLVPEIVARRPKQPYRAPDAASFFPGGRTFRYVAELLAPDRLAAAGLFDPRAVGLLVDKCRAGKAIGFADNMAMVGILSTMLLDEMVVRGAGPLDGPALAIV